jgi:hypothetical protein
MLDSARFMALIAVAKSDAFVAVFDAKYHYDFWLPITRYNLRGHVTLDIPTSNP